MQKLKKALGASIALMALALVALPAHADTSTMTVVQSSKSGASSARVGTGLVATTRTYKFRNDGRTFLQFIKTGSGACTVTITTPGTAGGVAIADVTVNVPATTGDVTVGPLSMRLFNDGNGDVSFTVSDTAGLSMTAIRL